VRPWFAATRLTLQLHAGAEAHSPVVKPKSLIAVALLLCGFCASSIAAEDLFAAEKREILKSVQLNNKPPEDFDWDEWILEGESIAEEFIRALAAVDVMKKRLDAVCAEYREQYKAAGQKELLEAFDEMQAAWLLAANKQVAYVGGRWGEGSGAKVAFPHHRCILFQRRIKELQDLREDF
jgi:hypothetical protein